MDISAAIDQLTKFKKMSKVLGECDLVGLDNESFVVKVKFNDSRSRDTADGAPVPTGSRRDGHPGRIHRRRRQIRWRPDYEGNMF